MSKIDTCDFLKTEQRISNSPYRAGLQYKALCRKYFHDLYHPRSFSDYLGLMERRKEYWDGDIQWQGVLSDIIRLNIGFFPELAWEVIKKIKKDVNPQWLDYSVTFLPKEMVEEVKR